MNNFDSKLKNNPMNNLKGQIDVQNKIKNNANINNKCNNNIPQKNNNIQNNNNFNINKINNNNSNENISGKRPKIGKIQNLGIFNNNYFNLINDHNYIVGELDKQYTPILKNENNDIQLFNYNLIGKYINNLNLKKEKDNTDIIKFHKRSKSSNKPIFKNIQNKNQKLLIKFINNNLPLINKDKKQVMLRNKNGTKKKQKNIKIINISPSKKKIIQENINANIQKEIKIANKNVNINKNNNINNNINISNNINQKNNINNMNNNIDNILPPNNIENNNNINDNKINNITNNQITIKTPPYISYAIYDYPNTEFRQQMEDFHTFKILHFQNIMIAYFSIFDGHGGNNVSIFLRDFFHQYLLQEIKSFSFSNDSELNKKNIITALNNSFEKIDKDIIDNQNFKNDIGSTGTIILLYREPNNPLQRVIMCANIGDSKGYIIGKNNINQITKDHNCLNEIEVNRIKNNKGLVFQGRVFGSLMLTRSFGDKDYKEFGVMAIPDIFSSLINDNDLYAIIASDGVWDVFSKENLFELSKEKISSEEFCHKIVVASLERGSRDNITCFVIKLNAWN